MTKNLKFFAKWIITNSSLKLNLTGGTMPEGMNQPTPTPSPEPTSSEFEPKIEEID